MLKRELIVKQSEQLYFNCRAQIQSPLSTRLRAKLPATHGTLMFVPPGRDVQIEWPLGFTSIQLQ
ncbi:MAG: hypothetical protein ACI9HK_001006 [Pirellulaceae bacterium]|jgi:hypothetical protein